MAVVTEQLSLSERLDALEVSQGELVASAIMDKNDN